jgi:hypothetical protein
MFRYLCQCSRRYFIDFLGASESLPFQNTFSSQQQEQVWPWQVRWIWWMLQSRHFVLATDFLTKCWQMFKSLWRILWNFQLPFLLPLIRVLPEYSFLGHFIQHCAHAPCFRHLSQLTFARNEDSHWNSHGHSWKRLCPLETCVFLITALPYAFQAFLMSLMEICLPKHKASCPQIAYIRRMNNS